MNDTPKPDMMAELRRTLAIIKSHGYQIREEWLDGAGGGACEIRGKKVFFSDQSLPLPERLEQAATLLAEIEQ